MPQRYKNHSLSVRPTAHGGKGNLDGDSVLQDVLILTKKRKDKINKHAVLLFAINDISLKLKYYPQDDIDLGDNINKKLFDYSMHMRGILLNSYLNIFKCGVPLVATI